MKVKEHKVVVGEIPEDGIPTYKKRMETERWEKLRAKRLHGRFIVGIEAKDDAGKPVAGPRSWDWVKAGYITPSTEAYLFAAQEQAINTNSKRHRIYKEKDENGDLVSGMCRVCGLKQETVAHVVGGCGILMQGPGTIRHNKVGARVHWELCRKYGVPCSERWYEHRPQEFSVNTAETVRLLWDSSHYTAESVRHNKPDVVVVAGDHSTPAVMAAHSWHPVPVLIYGKDVRSDLTDSFGERAAIGGELGLFPAKELMPLALAHAGKLAKYGA